MNPSNLPKEQELILAILKVGPAKRESARELVEQNVQWDEVGRVAAAWGVFRLFVSRLKACEVTDSVPSDVLASWSRSSMGVAAQNMVRIHEFLKVWRKMREQDIKAVVVKGPVLGIQAYGDSMMRLSSDIDLIMPGRHVGKTIDLLADLGFRCRVAFTRRIKEHWAKYGRDFAFHSDRLSLDVHQQLEQGPPFFRLTDEEWDQMPVLELESEDVFVLSPEQSLLALSIHGMRHLWAPLKFLIDLAHFVHREKENIDWGLAKNRARKMGCRRIVAIGLHLAKEVCGLELPDAAEQAFPLDKRGEKNFRRYQQRIRDINPQIGTIACFFAIHENLDSFWLRLRHAAFFMFTPSPLDFMLISLPKSLHFVYYVIRPFRLAWRFLVKRG